MPKFIKKAFLALILLSLTLLICTLCLAFFRSSTYTEANTKPKILVTNFHPNHAGGHSTYIYNLITGPLSNEYEFTVATPASSDIYQRIQSENIYAFATSFPGGIKELWPALKAMIHFYKICTTYKPDIIHTNGGRDNTIAAWVSIFLPQKPAIIRTFHSSKKIGKDPYHWLLYNKLVQQQIFVSQAAFNYNQSLNGLKPPHAVVIENGIDLKKFSPKAFDQRLAQQLDIKRNEFIFGSCAGLADCKRVDLLLQAAAEVSKDYHFKVLVLGQPDQGECLTDLAQKLGLKDIFIYAGQTTDVRPYNSLFTVGFILSDRQETLSYAAREMLAMGIPLISSSYSGLKDNIKQHYNGVLIEPGSLEELKSAMLYYLTLHQRQLDNYRLHAREMAESSFSATKQWNQLDKLYRQALKTNKSTESTKQASAEQLILNLQNA